MNVAGVLAVVTIAFVLTDEVTHPSYALCPMPGRPRAHVGSHTPSMRSTA